MNFNVWADGQHGKTTIIAVGMNEALDIFCQRHGFIDYPDYCGEEKPELNIEEVKSEETNAS